VLDPALLAKVEDLEDQRLDDDEIGERLGLTKGWQDEDAVRLGPRPTPLALTRDADRRAEKMDLGGTKHPPPRLPRRHPTVARCPA
jgi:hypothetical protein